MSRWGDDFRQDVVDAIDDLIQRDNSNRLDKMQDVFEAVAFMADNCFSKDEALKQMREDAVNTAKRELLAKMNG